jgi:asparagine synthase (glutamine-hydrolysing)
MSLIAGIYNLNGSTVDEETLALLGKWLSVRGPDGGKEVKMETVGMAYRAFHINREARLEQQPAVSKSGCILSWDGRLDNREELISLLRDNLNGYLTDVAIVMAAYDKWGEDFLPRLIGDFALALWDSKVQTLLLARDAFGARPLYYTVNDNLIIWSSILEPLLSLVRIQVEVDDEYVAGFLATGPDLYRTPYKHIRTVVPGSVIIVTATQFHERRYWALNPNFEIRYKTDQEYEEQFRDLFIDAVRCRLRASGGVWAELSGGLDSSSIVCVGDRMLADGEVEATNLETVSYIFDESSTANESAYINVIEEKRGKAGCHVKESNCPLLPLASDDSFKSLPSMLFSFSSFYKIVNHEMENAGARVLLTGQGGDHLLWSGVDASPEIADFLVRCSFLELHRSITTWAKVSKQPYLQLLWKGGLGTLFPKLVGSRCNTHLTIPAWFGSEFSSRLNVHDRFLGPTDIFGYKLPSRKQQSSLLLAAISFVSAGQYNEWTNIDVSFPYLHRPLVEFLLAIPFEQLLRPGDPRSLHRRALKDILPEKICRRDNKRGTTEALIRALNRDWPILTKTLIDARIYDRKYVEPQKLRKALDLARYGRAIHSHALWKTVCLEYWLRALERRSSETLLNGGGLTTV